MLYLIHLALVALVVTVGTPTKQIVDAQTISLVVGIVIPLFVGLLSKAHASSGLKAIVNAGLSAIAGALSAFASTGFSSTDAKTLITAIVTTWVVSIATYYGVYKPTGVSSSVLAKTGNFGLGSSPALDISDGPQLS